jgi:predicted metalloprotease with PDZ domain
MRLDTTGRNDSSSQALRSFLGADLFQQGERVIVSRVYAGSPAYEQGLNTGDWIAAIDGFRGSQNFIQARLDERKPGDVVHLTIFRNDTLRNIDVKLGSRNGASYRIIPVSEPTNPQKTIYRAWLGAPFSQ